MEALSIHTQTTQGSLIYSYLCSVAWDVLGEEQLVGGRVLAQSVLRGRARVYERLRDHRQTRVHRRRLGDVEDEVWILDEVHPEPESPPRSNID